MKRILFPSLIAIILLLTLSKADPFNYEALNYAAFESHNRARTDPGYFGQLAQSEIDNKFVYDRNGNPTNTICLAEDFIPKSNKCYFTMATNEGPSAWREASKVLSSQNSNLQPLQWSEGLSQACYDHVRDSGPQGLSGHTGSDGSSPHQRIARYVDTMSSGENIAYSDTVTGEDMILQLLVDDGVPNRGHRTNILSSDFTHIGISCGCHAYYTEVCCYAYGTDVKEKKPSRKADVAPQLKTCSAYSPTTKGTTKNNFNVSGVSTPVANKGSPTKPNKGGPKKPSKENSKKTNKGNKNKNSENENDLALINDMFPGFFEDTNWGEPSQNNVQSFSRKWSSSQTNDDDWNFGGWSDDSDWNSGEWSNDFFSEWN